MLLGELTAGGTEVEPVIGGEYGDPRCTAAGGDGVPGAATPGVPGSPAVLEGVAAAGGVRVRAFGLGLASGGGLGVPPVVFVCLACWRILARRFLNQTCRGREMIR